MHSDISSGGFRCKRAKLQRCHDALCRTRLLAMLRSMLEGPPEAHGRRTGRNKTQCQQCSQLRSSRHFESSSDICNACTFRASFEIFICSVCNKAKHSKDMREKDIGGGDFLCSGCAPNLWLFECTACHEVKPATDFRDFRNGIPKLEKQTIRRCKRCEICMGCKRHSKTSATSRRTRNIAAPAIKD